jgi:hypothetical protein
MDDMNFIKGTVEDDIFHRSRRMFCIKDGEVKAGPENSPLSHLEWFEQEGWVNGNGVQEFLEKNIRGFYMSQENKIYFYKGMGWNFDDQLLSEVIRKAAEAEEALGLNDDTEIYLGPKDDIIAGIEQTKKYVGKLKDITEKK